MQTRTEIAIEFLHMVAAGQVNTAYARHVAVDFRHHNPFFQGDAASLANGMQENANAFPHKQLQVQQTMAEGEQVMVLSHVMLQPDTPGLALVHIFRFQGDKIIELWDIGQPIPAEMINENGMF
ncbi:nuclear transport factor 2 family protein [Leeia oryzae]|uniref:nuclear transport factor 2 family protein n=1 Tax=Leeia oryzae TaxID=356662 RepID=UPI0003A3B00D|nr:nuclear transport factor 2 family protein [Leeia oryzae]